MKKTLYGITGNAGLGKLRKLPHERKSKYRKINGVPAHRLIVEQRTGIKLKPHNQIHHFDPNDKFTNEGTLVVCEDASYHQLIERRQAAYFACGNANWIMCYRCFKYDDPKNLYAFDKKDRPGLNRLHYVHEWRDGKCVDLTFPRPVNAGRCDKAEGKRHSAGTRFQPRNKKNPTSVGLTSKCCYCAKPIRRASSRSIRWFATSDDNAGPTLSVRESSVGGK